MQLEHAEALRRAQKEEGVREMRRRSEAMREQMQLRTTQLEQEIHMQMQIYGP